MHRSFIYVQSNPTPPETDPSNSKAFDKAADRILDHYLKPKPGKSEADSGQLFTVANGVDTETLLANLSENLASANAMVRSEEHTSELQSLMRNSYAVFCLNTKQIN